MFGILKPGKDRRKEWRREYCHACGTLKVEFGRAACPFISYEAVFLRSLLRLLDGEAIPATSGRGRCAFWHQPSCRKTTRIDKFWAAVGLLLAKVKLDDEVADSTLVGGLGARLIRQGYGGTFNRAVRTADKLAPGLTTFLEETIQAHRRFEGEESFGGSPEGFCHPAAAGLAECFGFAASIGGHGEHAGVLRKIGYHLGRIIVAYDAWRDEATDRRAGAPNPLLCFPEWKPGLRGAIGESIREIKGLISGMPSGRGSVPMSLVEGFEKRWRVESGGRIRKKAPMMRLLYRLWPVSAMPLLGASGDCDCCDYICCCLCLLFCADCMTPFCEGFQCGLGYSCGSSLCRND